MVSVMAGLPGGPYKPRPSMFTGLVQDVGTVERVAPGRDDRRCGSAPRSGRPSFALGESIAVDGACLTVVERGGDASGSRRSPETLRRTTLGELRSRRAGEPRAGAGAVATGSAGTWCSGHVDGVRELLEPRPEGGSRVLAFALPAGAGAALHREGLGDARRRQPHRQHACGADRFTVPLIPETQARTTLGAKAVGRAGEPGGGRDRQVRGPAVRRCAAPAAVGSTRRCLRLAGVRIES